MRRRWGCVSLEQRLYKNFWTRFGTSSFRSDNSAQSHLVPVKQFHLTGISNAASLRQMSSNLSTTKSSSFATPNALGCFPIRRLCYLKTIPFFFVGRVLSLQKVDLRFRKYSHFDSSYLGRNISSLSRACCISLEVANHAAQNLFLLNWMVDSGLCAMHSDSCAPSAIGAHLELSMNLFQGTLRSFNFSQCSDSFKFDVSNLEAMVLWQKSRDRCIQFSP